MDINLNNQNDNDNNEDMFEKKTKRGFLASSLATMLIILIFATVSVVSYLPIRNAYFPVESNVYEYLESNEFVYNLANLTRKLQQSVNNTNDGYDDRYVNVKSIKYKISPLEENINTNVEHPEQTLENQVEGAETVEETSEDTVLRTRNFTNMVDPSESKLQQEIDNSILYMKITFDENGYPAITNSLGGAYAYNAEGIKFNKDVFTNRLTYSNEENLEAYANLEVEYIIPQDFESYEDVFTTDMKEMHVFPSYTILILVIGAISILILTIVAFAVPYSVQSNMGICRIFNKMFLELKFFTWIGFIGLCAIIVAIIDNSYNGYYSYYVHPLIKLIYDVNPYFYLVGIILTFLLYFLIYLNIVYLKYIYHTGLKEGLIDNSFFGKVLLYCVRNLRGTIKRLTQIDLREDNYRKLIAIVGINLLAIWILGSGRFLGFLLSIGYTFLIFKYLLKIFDKAKQLNDASSQVAEGNFNINLDEDMGILSPMAKNLNNINKGFSLAVDKEIKSQRMKSELISNVSHDLKTPLTSIITYVDLLKNEDVDRDTQNEYIDILDRKSQRLKVLIEDLFEASKATSGNVDLHLEKIDVVALFRQTLGELEEKINDSRLQFKINAPENKVICNLDGKRTYRVFENIMTNILKYSMENSRVYIDILEEGSEVSFTFKNVSAYEMNFDASEITERFTRGDESRNTEGSGLGLSIAKSFVDLQEGTLEIVIDGDLFKLIVTFPKIA